MRKILALAWSDVRFEFADRFSILFFLVLPLVSTAILGMALTTAYSDPNADNRSVVAVVDDDSSALSARLIDALAQSTVVRPSLKTAASAQAALADQSLSAVLHIPQGFGAQMLAGTPVALDLKKAPSDVRAVAAEQAVSAAATMVGDSVAVALACVAQAEQIKAFDSPAARSAYFDASLVAATDALRTPPASARTTRGVSVSAQTPDGFQQSSAGQLVTWVLITLLGASVLFVEERVRGTLRRLVITPTRRSTILAGKLTGRLGLGLVQMTLLIVLGKLLFGVDWGRSPLALVLVVVSFGLCAVSLGVFLGTLSRTRGQAMGLTILFSMLLGALGGAWWPIEITPPIYQAVVKVLPTTWAMTGFHNVITRGLGVSGVLPQVGILLGFAVVFFALGIPRLKYE